MHSTRKIIRDRALDTTKQQAAQIGSLVETFINMTLQEIASPGWAFKNEKYHLWSWLKRKTTFTATAEDTVMERDVDKIALLRQIDSPRKIDYISDEDFYKERPYPTETGDPRLYRLWEITGIATKLAAANTIKVVSNSALDNSDYELVVSGYRSGRLVAEEFVMNGVTQVSGSITFDAREIFISKSGIFNGIVTVTDGSANAVTTLGPEEISPRHKVVSLWPTPSSTEVYMEYYKRIKELNHDHESPEFDPKWHHVVYVGTLTKIYEYLGKTNEKISTATWYQKLVRAMVADDECTPDRIDYLKRHNRGGSGDIHLQFSSDTIT